MSGSNDYNDFFADVSYVATAVALLILGLFIGFCVGGSPKCHHASYYNEHGEITCKICKELLEKGRK